MSSQSSDSGLGSAGERGAERPVRVCYLLEGLDRAGSELRVLRLIRDLDRRRVEPMLCLLDGESDGSQALEPTGCEVLRLGVSRLRAPSTLRAAARLKRFLREHEVDVLELYGRDATIFGTPVGRAARVPRIVGTAFNEGHWMTPFDRVLMRNMSRFLDATITNCDAAKRAAIANFRVVPESVRVLRNGIDLAPYSGESVASPVESAAVHFGLVANLRPVKDPLNFIEAAARVASVCPQARFSVAGDGELYEALAKRSGALGLAGRIQLCGSVRRIPEFLAELDVGVLCSLAEGASNALLEFGAANLAVIATAVGGNVELVEDSVTGLLVPPRDPEALASAMIRMVEDAPLRARCGSALHARVHADFGNDAMCERYARFYAQLVPIPRAANAVSRAAGRPQSHVAPSSCDRGGVA